jgi:hypothetical protein
MTEISEIHVQNEFITLALSGLVKEDDLTPKMVKLEPDRSLSIFSQLAALSDGRRRIIVADSTGLLRIRPYEAQHPLDGVLMPGGLTSFYTSTDAESRVWVEVVNTLGASATCNVTRFVNSGSSGFEVLPSGTPVREGVGIRSSSPPNSCTIHLTIDRFNATGDTP